MNKLPPELQINIISYLSQLDDVLELRAASKHFIFLVDSLWPLLLNDRFLVQAPTHMEAFKLYKQAHLSSIFQGSERLGVAWGENENYWRKVDDSTCMSGKSISLIGVFWLHVSAAFRHPLPGTYTPKIRLSIHSERPYNSIMRVALEAHVKIIVSLNEDIMSEKLLSFFRDEIGDGEWVTICLSDICVVDRRSIVKVEVSSSLTLDNRYHIQSTEIRVIS